MKYRYRYILIFITFILQSCDTNLYIEEGYLKNNAETALAFTKKDLKEYNQSKFEQLKDSLQKTSGFLGYKNIEKYFKSNDENLEKQIIKIWNGIYDKNEVNNIVNNQITGLISGTGLNKEKYLINVTEDDSIKWYAEKVSLSGFMLAFEYVIEFIVGNISGFVIAFIISFFAMFLFGLDLSESTRFFTFLSIVIFVIVMITTIKADNKSQEILENKVVDKITENTLALVVEKFNLINDKYSKIKGVK